MILLDISLPGGGELLLLDRLRSNVYTNPIPVIIATAHTTPGLEAKARGKGAVAFLNKPFEKQALLDTLHALPETAP